VRISLGGRDLINGLWPTGKASLIKVVTAFDLKTLKNVLLYVIIALYEFK